MIKKKCILFICGILINNKSPFESLFNNVIKPNSNNFDFQLIINTSYKYKLTSKWNDNKIVEYDKYSYEKRLIELLKLNINKDLEYILNNLKIEYLDIPDYYTDNGLGSHIPWYRLSKIFKKNKYYNYDFYIYFRPDTIISKNININDYINKFSFISSKDLSQQENHNRDWDLMFMGNEFLFKFFIYSYMNYLINISMNDNTVKQIIIKDEIMNEYDFKNITNKIGFIPDKGVNNHFTVTLSKYMMKNGYKVRVLDDQQIFVDIIRDSKSFDIDNNDNNINLFIFIILMILILLI